MPKRQMGAPKGKWVPKGKQDAIKGKWGAKRQIGTNDLLSIGAEGIVTR
jgi:hypothetical protein